MIVLSKAETDRGGKSRERKREGSEDIIGRRPVGGRGGKDAGYAANGTLAARAVAGSSKVSPR